MSEQSKGLYDALPASIQNLLLTGYSVYLDYQRYGGDYQEFKSFLEKSQWFSPQQLREYQEEKLRDIIQYSVEHVPYYRRIFSERGLTPADVQTLDDLTKLPVLTRDLFKKYFHELLSDEYDFNSVKKGHTSGTTGSPIEICYSDYSLNVNYAMMDRQYLWAGARLKKFGDRVAVLRGNPIVPLSQKHPPFWRHNLLHRQILFSAFHMSQENLPLYVEKLVEFSPKILDGYPSTLYVLAKHLKNKGEKLKLHAVISSSETLYDFQREVIEESFECKIFDYFAAAERVLFSTECDRHEGHHIAAEYGITEVLDSNSEPLGVDQMGVLVATSLHNYAMPLIRYATNDMSSIKSTACSCGRGLPLMDDVATKAEDLLTLSDGRLISPSVLTHPFKPLTAITESQIIQEDINRIRILLVTGEKFSTSDEKLLIEGLRERLGDDVGIEIEKVDSLERTRAGKFKWVISKVTLGI